MSTNVELNAHIVQETKEEKLLGVDDSLGVSITGNLTRTHRGGGKGGEN
jgi:hypothetical protein